ncbi:MAG: M42 family peptidase, partial [Pseudoflavonifractor sp.]
MNLKYALERLCGARAPSGFEQPAAEIAAELLRPLVDEVSTDRQGNVIGIRRCGKQNAPRLLLDAHLDEIGLIVTGIEDGFLRFRSIGGVDPRMLPDREV